MTPEDPGWSRSFAAWTNGRVMESNRDDRIRLLCFPHAGSSASVFRAWAADLEPIADVWPIQLPGRGGRWGEPPARTLRPVVDVMAAVLAPLFDKPFGVFGHSMGGFIAFELARALRRRGGETPACLITSATRAPHLPDPDPIRPESTDEQVVQKLRALEGIPEEVLADAELLRLLLPTIRADLELCAAYTCSDEPPLACPVAALGGADDPDVPAEHIKAWGRHTSGRFSVHMYPGKHFFVFTQRTAVLRTIAAELLGATSRAAS